ncbi:putative 2OG-Fe(II) oxygenase [soil metagenome]
MSGPPPALAERLANAETLLRAGQATEAGQILVRLTQVAPQFAEAHRLLGVALQVIGDREGAGHALRNAVNAEPKDPANHAEFGAFMAVLGRREEAEQSFRTALSLNPGYEPAAVGLCRVLVDSARVREALGVTLPLARAKGAGESLLAAHAQALSALGRHDDAITALEVAVQTWPQSGMAEYRLAAALQEVGRHAKAELAIRSAMARGRDAPEAWLVLAHAVQDQGCFDEAETCYREALKRRSNHAQAHNDLAELIWMRTGDQERALEPLNAALAAQPDQWGLSFAKARALTYAGDAPAALAELLSALTLAPDQTMLLTAAARAAWQAGAVNQGVALAERALKQHPEDKGLQLILAQAALTAGDAVRASDLAASILIRFPFDQLALAVQATAWRLLGDERYEALCDYDALVKSASLEPPPGWSSLEAYLADLVPALHRLHALKAHPFGQPMRGGTQVTLRGAGERAAVALPQALRGPIKTILTALGKGDDPVRRLNKGTWRFKDVRSVKLSSAGFHDNHVHAGGWLSAALHVELPDLPRFDVKKAGWLTFGEPGLPTKPMLAPERHIRPEAGRLVLFPSYMWHGTVPFTAERPRLTVAFELSPE